MPDKGNSSYSDVGTLGSYCTSETQFPNPEGVKTFSGYGASDADLVRGFVQPTLRELPAYDKINYQQRSTLPKKSMDDDTAGSYAGALGIDALENDFEFRRKKLESKGFLTRPHTPTDR